MPRKLWANQPFMAQLTIGTGLGGGVVYEGQLIDGQNGAGLEAGHIWIPEGMFLKHARQFVPGVDSFLTKPPTCGCGRQ